MASRARPQLAGRAGAPSTDGAPVVASQTLADPSEVAAVGRQQLAVIRTTEDLDALLAGRLHPRRGAVRLQLHGVGDDEARRVGDRLTRLRRECGCSLGGKAGLLATLATMAWTVIDLPVGRGEAWLRVSVSVGLILAATACGKLAGIYLARRAIRRETGQLKKRIAGMSSCATTHLSPRGPCAPFGG